MRDINLLRLRNLSCRICDEAYEKVVNRGRENERVNIFRRVKIPEHATNLVQSSTSPVPGKGSYDARYMFIGESPGEWEDENGEAFGGRSGKYLKEKLLKQLAKIDVNLCWFTNVIKCHPRKNRNPYNSEIAACWPWLRREIDLVEPEVIFTIGLIATKLLLPSQTSMKACHGQKFDMGEYIVIPLYHPASVNRAVDKKTLELDYMRIPQLLEGLGEPKPKENNVYNLVRNQDDLKDLIDILEDYKGSSIAIDIETVESNYARGLGRPDPITNELGGIGISLGTKETTYYIPLCDHPDSIEMEVTPYLGFATWEAARITVLLRLQFYFNNTRIFIHNAKFEMNSLYKYGTNLDNAYCTYLAAYTIQEDSLGLKAIVHRNFGFQMTDLSDLIDLKTETIEAANLSDMYRYGCDDTYWCYQYGMKVAGIIQERGQIDFLSILRNILPWAAEAEREGIPIDEDKIDELIPFFKEEIAILEGEIFDLAGKEFNVRSSDQKAEVLFDDMNLNPPMKSVRGGKVPKMTESGKRVSVNKNDLKPIAFQNPIISKLIEHGGVTTNFDTFVKGLPKHLHPETGLIHPQINQAGTVTTRFAYKNPSVQNIPVRTALGKRIREAFHAGMVDWWVWAIDQSQVELRWAAHLSQDEWMLQQFLSGNSIHKMTCMEIYQIDEDDPTWTNQYKNSKNGNFARLYGAMEYKLAETLEISLTEARWFLNKHRELMPGFEEWTVRIIKLARRKGYAETPFGYRRYIPQLRSSNRVLRGEGERFAVNTPIQGGAQNHIQLGMSQIHRYLENKYSRMMFQVHDEVVGISPSEELVEVVNEASRILENVVELSIPTPVEAEVGFNWGEMITLEQWKREYA